MTDDATPAAREVLDEPPGLPRVVARALRPGGAPTDDALPGTTVVRHDVTVDRRHVAAYADVCGARVTDRLPPAYPHLLTFPLQLHLLTDDSFPFPPLGLVHLHQRIVVHRPVAAEEHLDLAVRAADRRPHRRGEQFDVHATVTSADEVVWTGLSTYLHRGEEPSAPPAEQARPTDAVDVGELPTTGRWRVAADTGRRYGAVSGDRNPIHLSVATARPFGFDRPIAHGMWSLARCLAGLEGRLPAASTTDVTFGAPLFLPGRVRYATARRGDDWLFGLDGADDRGRAHLTGVVAPT